MNKIIINNNCIDSLKNIQDNSIDCIITSPPYFQQRNYNNLKMK